MEKGGGSKGGGSKGGRDGHMENLEDGDAGGLATGGGGQGGGGGGGGKTEGEREWVWVTGVVDEMRMQDNGKVGEVIPKPNHTLH
jgi:hypothetical protein